MTAIKRKLVMPRRTEATPKPTPISSDESGAQQIANLPALQKAVVIDAIKSGYRNIDIAAMFAEQGWLTVSEKTFIQYLSWYKRIYSRELVPDQEDTTGPRAPSYSNLDGVIKKLQPRLDEEAALEQVVRLQSVRLRMGVQFEQSTGIVNSHLHKDVNSTLEALKTLATMRGRLSGQGRPSAHAAQPVTQDAAAQLRAAELSEQAQDGMAQSLEKLMGLLKEKDAASQAQTQG